MSILAYRMRRCVESPARAAAGIEDDSAADRGCCRPCAWPRSDYAGEEVFDEIATGPPSLLAVITTVGEAAEGRLART